MAHNTKRNTSNTVESPDKVQRYIFSNKYNMAFHPALHLDATALLFLFSLLISCAQLELLTYHISTTKKLFIQYNSILPLSAAVERLFGFAGFITRLHRRCLSDKTFEELLLLKEKVL